MVLALPSAHAQPDDKNNIVFNPRSSWEVTDKATDANPYCIMRRDYNPNISVKVTSDISGNAEIEFINIPSSDSPIISLTIDEVPVKKLTADSTTQANALLGRATDELSNLYSGEFIKIIYQDYSEVRLPIQSTAVAEARMALCVDVIDQLKNINTRKAENIDLAAIEAEKQKGDLFDILPVSGNNVPPPSEAALDDVETDPIAELIDKVSQSKPEPEPQAATEEPIDIIDAASIEMADEAPEQIENISAVADIEQSSEESITMIDAPLEEVAPQAEPEQAVAAIEATQQKIEDNVEVATENENINQRLEEEIKTAEADIEAADTPAAAPELDPMLDVESLIGESLPPSPPEVPQEAYADDAEESVELNIAEIEDAVPVEDFGVAPKAEDNGPATEVMDDADILNALEESLSATEETPAQSIEEQDIEVSDVPLEDLAVIKDQTIEASEDVAVSDDLEAEEITELDQALIDSLDAPTDEAANEQAETEAMSAQDKAAEETLFEDDLSIEISDDASISAEEDENLVEELSNEDFSDEELLALLDDPEALSDDFGEILIEEEFKKVKPMEGVREMLGLGTPDEIAYKKVPWLIEEDIDEQWKEKVKLLEREKEMLRLRLADTKANPIADLISRKRNRRTQEELVEKIRALEAENEKLKKGLMLSKTPEDFINDDIEIKDPKSGMRMGSATTNEIDLIDQEIDSELDSLETRMDSFLKGVGEDYALANPDQVSPLSSSSLTQDIINILKEGYVVDPDALKIRAYRHKSTGTAVTAWEAGDLQGRAERTVLPPQSNFTAYVDRFLNAAQLRCDGNFTAVPDTSTRNLRSLDIHCNDGAVGQRSSVLFVKHGSIITAIATTTSLPKGDADYLRDIRKRLIEGIRVMDRKKKRM